MEISLLPVTVSEEFYEVLSVKGTGHNWVLGKFIIES